MTDQASLDEIYKLRDLAFAATEEKEAIASQMLQSLQEHTKRLGKDSL